MSHSRGPFAGVRIIELANSLAAPGAAAVLADQGADVIKVEPPGVGDILRYIGASRNGISGIFEQFNRGKRSIALNLKDPEGQAILQGLVRDADVVLHNFRPGVAERIGAGYAQLKGLNPGLIYATLTGFGTSGPYAGRPAYDNVVQAFAGIAYSQENAQTGEPQQYYQVIADKLSGLTTAQAIGAALFARERGAGGQEISVAMIDAVAAFLWPDASGTAVFGNPEGAVAGQQVAKGNRLMKFRDGWAQIAPVDDSSFQATCRILGEDVSGDERFATVQGRNRHAKEVRDLFVRLYFRAESMFVDEVVAQLEAADVPCAKALRVEELPDHPQFQANELFVTVDHPRAGPIRLPRTPACFDGTPPSTGARAPFLGEHTEAILAEIKWQSNPAALRERRVIG
ncbi:MAG: CoA transferase [Rhodocyclaceae bacterium]|nr:CoA transferase [Rhodocyclaceae bacterium]